MPWSFHSKPYHNAMGYYRRYPVADNELLFGLNPWLLCPFVVDGKSLSPTRILPRDDLRQAGGNVLELCGINSNVDKMGLIHPFRPLLQFLPAKKKPNAVFAFRTYFDFSMTWVYKSVKKTITSALYTDGNCSNVRFL